MYKNNGAVSKIRKIGQNARDVRHMIRLRDGVPATGSLERVTTTLLLGAAMLVAAGIGFAGSRTAAVLLIVLSVVWLVLSVRPEGPILWTVTPEHGLVLADLWGLLGLVVGGVLLVRSRRRRPVGRRAR